MARVVCDQLSTQFRQPVVVENRAGAGTAIAAAFVAKSDPDGYTVLVNSSAHTISPLLQPNPTFDPGRDFSAVIPFGNSPNVLVVSPSRGFKTVGDLLAAARAKPGSLNFASAGVGSGVHMSAERFLASAGIVAVHVPFKGSPEAITEVMAGRVDFYFSPGGLVVEHIHERKLLPLADSIACFRKSWPATKVMRAIRIKMNDNRVIIAPRNVPPALPAWPDR